MFKRAEGFGSTVLMFVVPVTSSRIQLVQEAARHA